VSVLTSESYRGFGDKDRREVKGGDSEAGEEVDLELHVELANDLPELAIADVRD